jgi:hypothetical protein
LNPTSTNLDTPSGPQPAEEFADAPVWLQRLFAITYVIFCVTLGVWLVVLPWSGFWFDDGWVARWPFVERWLQHGFARGAVSGIGLIDIWLGILEAIRYHDRPTAGAAAPALDQVSHDQQQ